AQLGHGMNLPGQGPPPFGGHPTTVKVSRMSLRHLSRISLHRTTMSTRALIALGGNLGDRRANLDAAIAGLGRAAGVEVLAVSSYHETPPIGGPPGQGAFLNAAASLGTTLDPLSFLRVLQEAETRAGRLREFRWGERSLDLDLLLFGDQVIDT